MTANLVFFLLILTLVFMGTAGFYRVHIALICPNRSRNPFGWSPPVDWLVLFRPGHDRLENIPNAIDTSAPA